MKIANPIYDTVFKYLMDDHRVATLLLSAILGEEIVSLDVRPQEYQVPVASGGLTVYRLDFAARIRLPGGESRQVLIEVQKAKYPADILRFRKYLGEHYKSDANCEPVREGNREYLTGIPIVCIYFLGYWLDTIRVPVLRIKRSYIDVATGEEIHAREAFTESLTHDSFVIQIPALQGKRRTELENLLAIFDQSQRDRDHHILNVAAETFPEKYQAIVRRLQSAVVEPAVRETMEVEDQILFELNSMARAIASREKTIAEKENLIAEKENLIAEKENLIAEKENLIAAQENLIGTQQDDLQKYRQEIARLKRQLGE